MVDLDDPCIVARKEEHTVIHQKVVDDVRHREHLALLQCGDVRDEEGVAPLPDQEIPVGSIWIRCSVKSICCVRYHAACAVRQVILAQNSVYRIGT